MAQLAGASGDTWGRQQTIAQYRAIAWLRWRMLVNLSRRRNGAAEIIGRVILYCVMIAGALFLTFAAGGTAWFLASNGKVHRLWVVLWGIFVMCQLLNINLGQPGTTFDPTELIRFPLRVRTYVAIRLFFNLLSPANVMAMLMSMAVAVGVAWAVPSLALYAAPACLVFGATNVLFSRMVFAWVDRWLSTRRAREVFTFAILAFSLAFQYVNFTFNSAFGGHGRHHKTALTHERVASTIAFYHRAEPYVRYLPPNLTSGGLAAAQAGQPGAFVAGVAGCSLYGALFLFVFALRMRTEFHGESISDDAGGSAGKAAVLPRPAMAGVLTAAAPALPGGRASRALLPSAMLGVLRKEWIYMRRNVGLLFGLVTPLFLVVMAAYKWGHNAPAPWVLPIALMYSMLGLAPLSYNSFGLEGTGAQLYFMAPVPLREVFIAKNLLHFGMAFLEIVAVIAITTYVSAFPSPLMLINVLLWAVGTLLLNTTLGNRRSITAPKKINLSRMAGKQASQTSALMGLGVLLACGAYGAGILALAAYLSRLWLALPCFAALAAAGILVYRAGLRSLNAFTLAHRDTLFEELGKA